MCGDSFLDFICLIWKEILVQSIVIGALRCLSVFSSNCQTFAVYMQFIV